MPKRLIAIGLMFAAIGLLAVWQIIDAFVEQRISINLFAIGFPIGLGLLAGRRSARSWANVVIIFGYAIGVFFAIATVLSPHTLYFNLGSSHFEGAAAVPFALAGAIVFIAGLILSQRILYSWKVEAYLDAKLERRYAAEYQSPSRHSFTISQFLIFMLLAALLTTVVDRAFFAWRREAERVIRTRATTNTFDIQENSDIHSSLEASENHYSLGSYGICEIANTRIAVRGYAHPGSSGSSGSITLATDCMLTGSGGMSWGSGLCFSNRRILGGSHCVFGTLKFDIIDGTLYLLDQEFDIVNDSQCIIIDRDGKIESVVPIPPNTSPPDWKPNEPRIGRKAVE